MNRARSAYTILSALTLFTTIGCNSSTTDTDAGHDLGTAPPVDLGPCPMGHVCRPSAGPCDIAEVCGSDGTCPTDGFAAAGQVCRAAASSCDVAESCAGTEPMCPTDAPAPSGTVCMSGGLTGACDGMRSCLLPDGGPIDLGPPPDLGTDLGTPDLGTDLGTPDLGTDDLGPPDLGTDAGPPDLGPPDSGATCVDGAICRASAGPCDVDEVCVGGACPADGFFASGTVCRSSTGMCDPAETCSGGAATCPTNTFAPIGTPCTGGLTNMCDGLGMCV